MIETSGLAEWLSRLVQIPSVSPDQAGPRAGTPGEGRLAAAVAGWFSGFGGQVYQDEVLPGRANIYGLWQGRSERWIGVDVHLDTVSVEEMSGNPFSGESREGRVYGRGAVDDKASLGVILALLENMQQTNQMPMANLLIAATVDEEIGATGAPAFARWISQRKLAVDELIVAEPTGCGPVYGHKGVVRLEFQIQGKAAHSSQPEMGLNAITAATHVLVALEEERQRLLAAPVATALGSPTLTVSIIQGGTGINVVPATCQIAIDRRTVAGEDALAVSEALSHLAQQASPLPLTVQPSKQIDAFFQPPETAWVRQLAAWSGQEPAVVPYGTNAWAYPGVVRECIVLGPGSIDQAHGAEEWVEISELVKLADIYSCWWGIER